MRVLTVLAVAGAFGCAGCRGKSAVSQPPPEASALAAPVTAPMALRQRVLIDLEAQKAAARARQQDFDAATDTGR